MDDAAIHRVLRDTVDLSVRFLVHSGSPRAYALAMTRGRKGLDDKVWYFYHEGSEVVEFSHCHCEEDRMDNVAIHRVSGDAGGFVCSFIEGQWIATGLQPSR